MRALLPQRYVFSTVSVSGRLPTAFNAMQAVHVKPVNAVIVSRNGSAVARGDTPSSSSLVSLTPLGNPRRLDRRSNSPELRKCKDDTSGTVDYPTVLCTSFGRNGAQAPAPPPSSKNISDAGSDTDGNVASGRAVAGSCVDDMS